MKTKILFFLFVLSFVFFFDLRGQSPHRQRGWTRRCPMSAGDYRRRTAGAAPRARDFSARHTAPANATRPPRLPQLSRGQKSQRQRND